MLDRFLSLAEAAPHSVALIDGHTGEVTTRHSLLERARVLADRLSAAGLTAGETVAVQLPNSPDFVAAFIAALMLRLVVVPIDRDAPESERAKILEHFGIRGLVSSDDGDLAVRARHVARSSSALGDARLIKLTSGSTGKPKGIVTTEANLIADCTNICATMGIASTDVNLGAIPFSHSYGFSNLVTPLLLRGTPVVFSNEYLPQSLIDMANRHRCTVAPLIPMVFAHLTTTAYGRFETIRTFISAGAPLPADTSRRFRERFGLDVHSFYGCSECGGITYDRIGGAVERGTVGEPLDGVDVLLAGGRLRVSSGSVASGYLMDANTFEPIPQGAYTTDDLAETRGTEIALTGRAGDVINTAGKKVNPREVETVLLEIEGVREVRVYGEPAGARGEVVAAAVVAAPGVTREAIREYCRSRLSSHKVPRIVKLLDEMPVDERGKVRLAALQTL